MNTDFYKKFEDRFRGSRELIKSRLQIYVRFIKPLVEMHPKSKAIDLGCGRGEWLETLEEHGYLAQGVDLDDKMLSEAVQLGLSVKKEDAIECLRGLASGTQLIVSGFHIIEHLPFDVQMDLIVEAKRVLKPGGLLILETPNPENLSVGATNFYSDPTHIRPIPPHLISFLSEYTGFQRTVVVRCNEEKALVDELKPSLLAVIYGASPDYSIVAQKEGPPKILQALDHAFTTEYGLELQHLANRFENRLATIEQQASNAINSKEETRVELDEIKNKLVAMNHIIQNLVMEAQHKNQLAVVQHQVAKTLLNSKSWRITKPLRYLVLLYKGLSLKAGTVALKIVRLPKRLIYKTFMQSFYMVNKHPKLKLVVLRFLSLMPTLKLHLHLFVQKQINVSTSERHDIATPKLNMMTPEAQHILLELKRYIKKLS